jgi:hypothetical protein
MGPVTNGDILSFLGAMLGAAITVLGSIWVINHQAWKRAARDKANLLSFLAMLEARLQFTRSDEELAEFVASRDVPGLINRCALILEMADLLDTPAVAEAADGFQQVYLLHRLRRVLKVWSPPFAAYADMPYTDFYLLASPEEFEEAVAKLVMPAAIIRAAVHLYICQITGRNLILEELMAEYPENQTWDPDRVFVPGAAGPT